MKTGKKKFWVTSQMAYMTLMVVMLFVFTGSVTHGAEKPIIIKLPYVHVAENPSAVASQRLAKLLEERTRGRVKVEIYPQGQLGQEREVFEGLQMGTVEMSNISTNQIGQFVVEMRVWDLPYLFRDSDHVYSVLDGPIGKKITEICLKKTGVRNLGYTENGWRHLTNRVRPINTPDDLKGLKIRVSPAAIMVETIKAFGASPVPIPWGELYLALSQGVVDGQENPHVNTYGAKLFEVLKYVSLTGHVYNPMCFLVNEKFFRSLPVDIQKIIAETSQECAVFSREVSMKNDSDFMKKLQDKGMIFNLSPDLPLFRAKARPVHEKFASDVGGMSLVNEIIETK